MSPAITVNDTATARKFVVTVITYHPPSDFLPRMEALLDAGFQLAIYDNTPALIPELEQLEGRCLWFGREGANKGLGYGLQALMMAARQAGFQWALYMDQDTGFTSESLRWMQGQLNKHANSLAEVAAIQCTADQEEARWKEKRLLINSGCLFQLQLLETWGGHDPSFFVECVDYKFCLDAAHHGYRLLEWPGCPGFDHVSLQPIAWYQIGSRQFPIRHYPWHRHIAFLGALLRLTRIALKRSQWMYAFRFCRNILTHLFKQFQFGLLSVGSRLGVVKKMRSFVIVVFNMLIE